MNSALRRTGATDPADCHEGAVMVLAAELFRYLTYLPWYAPDLCLNATVLGIANCECMVIDQISELTREIEEWEDVGFCCRHVVVGNLRWEYGLKRFVLIAGCGQMSEKDRKKRPVWSIYNM